MRVFFSIFFIMLFLPLFTFAQDNNTDRASAADYNLFIAGKIHGKFSTDKTTMEIAPYGINGGIEVNFQISRYFAIMPSIDITYTNGNNKGVSAESVAMGIKPYVLFQPEVKGNGFQPYAGIAPTYTLSSQNVVDSNTMDKCSYIKHQIGIGAAAGFNYIYKNFITGLNFEYNYILPDSKDDLLIHLDLASEFLIGMRFGYRF